MSTVEKEKEEKTLEDSSGCCGVDSKAKADLAAKVEIVEQAEAAKEKKAGGCGCG